MTYVSTSYEDPSNHRGAHETTQQAAFLSAFAPGVSPTEILEPHLLRYLTTEQRLISISLIAGIDVKSWQTHGIAQLQMFRSEEYELYYSEFIELRIPVEAFTFQIPRIISTLTAAKLGDAAKGHDQAEQETTTLEEANMYWSKVKDDLASRHLIVGIARHIGPTSGYMNHVADQLRNLKTFSEIKNWVISNKDLFNFNTDEMFEIAATAGKYEMGQWKAHHFREYDEFEDLTTKLLRLYGYSEEIAKEAASYLAEGCKMHDFAEEIIKNRDGRMSTDPEIVERSNRYLTDLYQREGNILQGITTQQHERVMNRFIKETIKSCWEKAYLFMNKHYKTLAKPLYL